METLDILLRLAKWTHIRRINRTGDDHERLPNLLDVRFAEYPYPSIYRRHLEYAVARCRSVKGMKQIAEKLSKRLSRETDEYVLFKAENDVDLIQAFVERAAATGFDVERIKDSLENSSRLRRAHIEDIHELRSALRHYLSHRAAARGDDPVRVAERELIGKKLPGFFPTPPAVIDRMLQLAEIESHQSVLEPSCGKGDILDALKQRTSLAGLHAIERNLTLADVLAAKGHDVEFGDFLEHGNEYDRIVMNPPFEEGADMLHVRHAFDLLRPGGRLVSVVSEGPLFRVDHKSVAFRDWLEERDAHVERLPDDAFSGSDVFRETSVRTRLVRIDKEAYA